jgi:putative SOS response-associated peptidase YedK
VTALVKPYPTERMEAYPVSSLVNSWENEGPELIAVVTPTVQLSF